MRSESSVDWGGRARVRGGSEVRGGEEGLAEQTYPGATSILSKLVRSICHMSLCPCAGRKSCTLLLRLWPHILCGMASRRHP